MSKVDKKKMKYSKNWKTNLIKKNEFWCVFYCNGKKLIIGYKRWSNIEEKYRKNCGKEYRIVILSINDIRKGVIDGFKEYFKMFGDISVCFNIANLLTEIVFIDEDGGYLFKLIDYISTPITQSAHDISPNE